MITAARAYDLTSKTQDDLINDFRKIVEGNIQHSIAYGSFSTEIDTTAISDFVVDVIDSECQDLGYWVSVNPSMKTFTLEWDNPAMPEAEKEPDK
jgi:hypothetical protein